MRVARRTAVAVALGVAMIAVFASAFVLAGHDPRPHGVRVAFVGGQDAADQLQAGLDEQEPGGFDVVRHDSPATARAALTGREVYGVLVPGSGSDELLVASGAGVAVAGLLQGVLEGRAATTGRTLQVEDVVPLATGDPRGVTLGLLVLPLVIASILGGMFLALIAGRGGRASTAAGLLALATAGGVVLITPARLVDALPGNPAALAGVAALAVLSIAAVSRGFVGLVGTPAVGGVFLVFLLVGNLGSGANSAPELLPGFWRVLGPLLPPGAAADALRGVAYFDGAGVARPLTVLAVWAGAGLVLTLLASGRHRTEPEQGRPTATP
jgi:hypothetical protein